MDAQKRRLLELADRAPEDIPPDLGEHIESDDPKQRIIHQEGLYAQSRTWLTVSVKTIDNFLF